MTDIKMREHTRDIKVLDKSLIAGERMNNAFVRSKNQVQNLSDDGEVSPSEYAENRVQYAVENTVSEVGYEAKHQADVLVEKGRKKYQEHQIERRGEKKSKQVDEALKRYDLEFEASAAREGRSASANQRTYEQGRERVIKETEKSRKKIRHTRRTIKGTSVKGSRTTAKSAEKGIKTAHQSSKATIKTAEATAKAAEKTAQATAKVARVSAQTARATARAAAVSAKVVAKAASAAVKAIIAGLKSLVTAIAAGGWIAVLVVTIICVIGLIAGSSFGIFFSSEENGDNQTMYEVVREINDEYMDKLDEIKTNNPHDELEMSGSRAVWPEVLSVYAVKVTTDPDNAQEVTTVTDEKIEIFKEIFWEMNQIDYFTSTQTITNIVESDDGNGNVLEEEVQETITTLRIIVSHKTAEEMALAYDFDEDQNEQLVALLDPENNSLWTGVLYGIYAADDQIVAVAASQLGNVGGAPYWSWYGFGSRVEWCACFVSWCANECGYIDMGVITKFALCSWGAQWFKDRGQWGDNSMEPAPGTIIFFDWEGDGETDHVGIVEYTEGGVVHTIEGNSSDTCRQRQYSVGSGVIYGYGLPAY